MLQVVADLVDLFFDGVNPLVQGLGVEFGNLPDRLFDEFEDVFHHDGAVQQVFVVPHAGENVVKLLLPAHLVLFEDFVDAVLEKDALQGIVMPFVLQFAEFDFELLPEDVAGMEGIVFEDVVHREELRLVILDDAGVRVEGRLAVGEGVQGVDGLVGRDVVGKVQDDLHLLGGHVIDFLDLDLAFVLGLDDRIDEHMGGLAEGKLGDGDGVLVHLLDPGPHLDLAAPLPLVVFGTVGDAAGGEVGIDLVGFPLENGDGGVEQFVEVVGEDFRGHADGDAFRPLRQQEREADRQFGRLLVAAVVGGHPRGDFLVEEHFLGETGEPGFDVTGSGIAVACEDVAPVPLAVDEEAFLSDRDESAQDGGVSVRVVLHGLADDVGHLGVAPVVHLAHRVEDPPLHRLEAVDDMRYGPLQDHIGGIVQEPVLEHARQLEAFAVGTQQPGELAARCRVCGEFLFLLLDRFFTDSFFPLFHI